MTISTATAAEHDVLDGCRRRARFPPVASGCLAKGKFDMVLAVFGVKGGVGVSTVCALLAASAPAGEDAPTLIIDLAGAMPALCGVAEERAQGVTEWAVALPDVPGDALGRLGQAVRPNLSLLTRGSALPPTTAAVEVVERLHAWPGHVVVDAGLLSPAVSPPGDQSFRSAVVSASERRVLVTRACYLGLSAVRDCVVEPTEVILLSEPGRALTVADVESVTSVPVVAEIAVDPTIARLVDSGLLVDRVPRRLQRCLNRSFDSAGHGSSRV